jgi:hypothetical protein
MAGVEPGWRIVVHIGSSQPELRAALADLPSRARAERLRQLALVGLYSLRGGSTAAPIPSAPQVAKTQTVLDERRERLLRALTVGDE